MKIKIDPAEFASEGLPDIPAMIDYQKKKLLRACAAYQEGIDTLEEYKKNKAELQSRTSELQFMQEHQACTSYKRIKQDSPICADLNINILERTDLSENIKNVFLRSITDCITFVKPAKTVKITYKL